MVRRGEEFVSLYPVRVRVRVLLFCLFRRATGIFPGRYAQLGGESAPEPQPLLQAGEDARGCGSFLTGYRDWIIQATSGFFTRLETSSRPRHSFRTESRTS